MKTTFSKLERLLVERLGVIADHVLRDRDPAAHLARLRDASLALDQEHQALRATLPARLNHFMQQSSYEKALAFIREGGCATGGGEPD